MLLHAAHIKNKERRRTPRNVPAASGPSNARSRGHGRRASQFQKGRRVHARRPSPSGYRNAGKLRSTIRGTGCCGTQASAYSGLIPVNFTTLPHFSVSSAIIFPKSAGDIGAGTTPSSLKRAFILDRKSTRLNSSHLGISYA